jgi:hypothetical protein
MGSRRKKYSNILSYRIPDNNTIFPVYFVCGAKDIIKLFSVSTTATHQKQPRPWKMEPKKLYH